MNAILTGNHRHSQELPSSIQVLSAIRQLFHGQSHRAASSFSASSLPSSSFETATVFKEEPRPFRRAFSTLSSEVIDLGTPSPKKKARAATVKEEAPEELHLDAVDLVSPVKPPSLGSPMDVMEVVDTHEEVHDPMDDLADEPEELQGIENAADPGA